MKLIQHVEYNLSEQLQKGNVDVWVLLTNDELNGIMKGQTIQIYSHYHPGQWIPMCLD